MDNVVKRNNDPACAIRVGYGHGCGISSVDGLGDGYGETFFCANGPYGDFYCSLYTWANPTGGNGEGGYETGHPMGFLASIPDCQSGMGEGLGFGSGSGYEDGSGDSGWERGFGSASAMENPYSPAGLPADNWNADQYRLYSKREVSHIDTFRGGKNYLGGGVIIPKEVKK